MDAGSFRFWFKDRISSTGSVDVKNSIEATPITRVLPAKAAPIQTPSSGRVSTLTKNNPEPNARNGICAMTSHFGGTFPTVKATITKTTHSMAGLTGSHTNNSATEITNKLINLTDGFQRVSPPGSTNVEGCSILNVVIPVPLPPRRGCGAPMPEPAAAREE